MEIAELITNYLQLGGNIAFPIIMCLLMFNYMKEITSVISENTLAIEKLSEKLDDMKGDMKSES